MKPTTVITGASRGIGYALAQILQAEGHHVVGLARSAPAAFPGSFIEVDLGDPVETQRAAEAILREHGTVQHLVNNVGLVKAASLEQVSLDDLDAVFNLNLKPALVLTQAFVQGMKAERYGRIVNVSSLVTLGMPERTSYAAAKSALVSFARSWALELAGDGITVNAVAPGPTETELFRQNNPPGSAGETRYLSAVPMGRFATPDEIAGTIAFLLGPSAGMMTGQTLHVDGGASSGRAHF